MVSLPEQSPPYLPVLQGKKVVCSWDNHKKILSIGNLGSAEMLPTFCSPISFIRLESGSHSSYWSPLQEALSPSFAATGIVITLYTSIKLFRPRRLLPVSERSIKPVSLPLVHKMRLHYRLVHLYRKIITVAHCYSALHCAGSSEY